MASRRSFTIKEKAKIIWRLKNGANNAALCKEFKVSHSTISGIWKNRDVILETFATKSSKIKKNRKPIHEDIENALLEWFNGQKSQNIMISGPALQEKANYIAKMLGKVNFECSEGWIYRFRQRYDISVGKVCGAARTSRNESDNWLISKKLQDSVNSMKTTEEKVPVFKLKTNSDFEQLITQVREDNTNQEVLQNIKTVSYCCFCGEVKNDFLYVIDKPYVKCNKTTLTLNDLSIELDFNKDSIKKTVCQNCDTKLKEIDDYLKLVKNAQDKLRHVTADDNLRVALDTQNEGPLNNDIEYSNGNVDDNNKAYEEHEERTKDYRSDTEFVKVTGTTHKRRNNDQTTSNLKKRGRFSIDSDSGSLPSLYNNDDESEMDNNEIELETDNKNEIDPFTETDIESLKAFSADNIHFSTEFTKSLHEDNVAIDIKEEMVEITDDSDKEVQKPDGGTKVIPFEIQQDTEDLASDVCKEVVRMDSLANQMNVTNKTGSQSDIVNEMRSECETVGAMPKSELVLLVQSIVSQMLNK